MTDKIKVIFTQVQERYVKVAWTHKIHECQSEIWSKQDQNTISWLTFFTALTTAGAVGSVFGAVIESNTMPIPVWLAPVITALVSTATSYYTLKQKDSGFAAKACENKQFAAKCHNLRNKYESLLTDIKTNRFSTIEEICKKRDSLEQEECELYGSQTVPKTFPEAVKMAEERLKSKKDSVTEEEEIKTIVPQHLQNLDD